MRRFQEGTITLRVGSCKQPQTFSHYLLRFPRQGMRHFWDMHAVYKLMGFSSFKGFASRWAYESKDSWQRFFIDLGFEGHCIQSPGGLGAEEAGVTIHRFLPATSVSTLGFVALLLRWSALPPNRGGLREPDRRAAAAALLAGLLASAASGGQWRLTFGVCVANGLAHGLGTSWTRARWCWR